MPIGFGSLAALDAIIIAGVIMLLFWASLPLLQYVGFALANIVENVPAVGSDLANAIRRGVNAMSDYITNTLADIVDNATAPITAALNRIANVNRANAYSTRFVQIHVVHQLNKLTLEQRQLVSQPTAEYVFNNVTQSESRGDGVSINVLDLSTGYTRDSYVLLADWANSAVQSLYSDIVDADARVQTTATTLENTINGVRDTAFAAISASQVETLTSANAFTVSTAEALGQEIDEVEQKARDEAITAQDVAIEHADKALQPVAENLGSLEHVIGDTVLPHVDKLERYLKDCGLPVCDNLLKFALGFLDIGNLLGGFDFIALIASAIHDPAGTARTIENESSDLLSTPVGIVNDVFGTHIRV